MNPRPRAGNNRTIVLDDARKEILARELAPAPDAALPLDEAVNRVFQDDCTAVMPHLPDGFAAMALLDPPYNLTKTFNGSVFRSRSEDAYRDYLVQSPVACDGLTLDALKQKLVKLYSEYYKQPQITVTFAPYEGKGVSPWGTVTVLGEVAMPGPVNMPSTMDLTVTKVLQAAGGLRPFANKSKIRVSRCDKDGKKSTYIIDLIEIGEKGRIEKDIVLRAGDVVWVPETWY